MGDTRRASPALFVGLAGDAPRTPSARISLDGIDSVEIGRGERRRVTRAASTLSLALADAGVAQRHARLTRMGAVWIVEDLGAQLARASLPDGAVVVAGRTALVFREAGGEAGDVDRVPPSEVLATLSPQLAAQVAALVAASTTATPIAIHREPGSGAELVARAVHALSGRGGPFVAVDCARVEVELVRTAPAGTLFLDDVTALSPAAQAAMVRALDGVRVVCASHRDLDAAVAANELRADLRARLLGVALAIPPLRERREDLAHLIAQSLDRHGAGGVTFSAEAVTALYAHCWPRNADELDGALAAMLVAGVDHIELRHVPPAPAPPIAELSDEDRVVRAELVAAIARHGGDLAAVARALGKDGDQVRRWMRRFGLDRA